MANKIIFHDQDSSICIQLTGCIAHKVFPWHFYFYLPESNSQHRYRRHNTSAKGWIWGENIAKIKNKGKLE